MDEARLKLSDPELQERVRKAVQSKGGEVTLGDVVAQTGLAQFEAERALKSLLALYEGHMRVSEKGDVVYVFDRHLIRRDHRSFWERNKAAIYKGFKAVIKAWIMVTLVVYFVVYLLLLLAIIFGNRNSNSSSSSSSGGLNPMFLIYLFWGRGSYGDDDGYYRRDTKPRVPFNKRIFQFIFGPEEEVKRDPLELQRRATQLIKSKRGVVCLEDWIMVTGHEKAKAESEMAHYSAIFDGDVEVSQDGNLVYTFRQMLRSDKQSTKLVSPEPSWKQLESKEPFTGNTMGSNIGIFCLNLFNLVLASFFAFAFFRMPPEVLAQQNIEMHPLLPVFLGYFPLVFSVVFFLIPLVRSFFHRKDNRARRKRNIKRIIHRNAFTSTALSSPSLTEQKVAISVDDALEKNEMDKATPGELKEELREALIDLDGNLESNDRGEVFYDFKNLRQSLDYAAKERERLQLDKQELGNIVFDTADDLSSGSSAQSRAEDRELELFSSELENYTKAQR